MEAPFKPAGYNSLSPYIISSNAQKLADLLGDVFNSTITRRYDLEDGKIMHAEIRIDDSILMFSDSNENYPPNQSILHVYVSDVEAVFAKAMAAGCKEFQPIKKNEGDPDKRGTFTDFDGNMWSVSTQQ
ncbi:MAG: VOC family protein [Rhizobacter sp.]|nr:VOC family protein [Ferruginibacter sp.]